MGRSAFLQTWRTWQLGTGSLDLDTEGMSGCFMSHAGSVKAGGLEGHPTFTVAVLPLCCKSHQRPQDGIPVAFRWSRILFSGPVPGPSAHIPGTNGEFNHSDTQSGLFMGRKTHSQILTSVARPPAPTDGRVMSVMLIPHVLMGITQTMETCIFLSLCFGDVSIEQANENISPNATYVV